MFKATSIDAVILRRAKEEAASFFQQLDVYWSVKWYKSQVIDKGGVKGYSDPLEIRMLIRTAEEARSNDLLIGIVLLGSHVGCSLATYTFRVGDIIVDSRGQTYTVRNCHRTTGEIYSFVDLDLSNTEDMGDSYAQG